MEKVSVVAKGLLPGGRCQPGLSLSPSGLATLVEVGCHSFTSPFIHPAAAILCLLGVMGVRCGVSP